MPPLSDSPGFPTPPPSPQQPSFHRYRWWEAAPIGFGMFGFAIFFFTESAIGVFFLWWLIALAYASVRDWRGVASLGGLIPWRRLPLILRIVLAVPMVALYPLLSCMYGARILWGSLPAQVTNPVRAFTSARLVAMSRWPLAMQVSSVIGAFILVCALCATGLTIIGANSPSAGVAIHSAPKSLNAHISPHATATPQATQAPQAPQATQVASTVATAPPMPTQEATFTPQDTPTTPPVVAPTQTPTATPRPAPTATPPPPPPPPTLSIRATCASAVDYADGQICVHTLPGAQLTIDVTYCSGYEATSRSLQGVVTANSNGDYTWSWKPETKCRGMATAAIDAQWNGQHASINQAFTVQ